MSRPHEGPLLIVFGALHHGRPLKRKILHRSVLRDGVWSPICNSHYGATHDNGRPRQFRPAEGDELEYRICGRCQRVQAFQ